MSEQKVTIIIDGKEIEAVEGQTILQAADAAGIYIPRLCAHKDLLPGGHCRVCTVKINGRPGSSCTFPVSEGLVVENDTEEINGMRKSIIEMLFVEGNHFCPSCEASGDCELQALGYRLGMINPEYPYLQRERELDASHDDVFVDRNRCVLCSRCIRASAQLDGKRVFGFEGRGIDKRIAVNAETGLGDTNLSADDRAATICPTGCLRIKGQGPSIPVGTRPYDKQPIGHEIEEKQTVG